MTDVNKLAESLRAMRRNARMHYSQDGKTPRYSIVIDNDAMLDMTEAATMLNVAAAAMAELAEWRSVFGHLGETPDDCGNAIAEARKAPAVLLTDEQLRAAYHSIDSGTDHSRTGIREERLRAIQTVVLAANGKAVS